MCKLRENRSHGNYFSIGTSKDNLKRVTINHEWQEIQSLRKQLQFVPSHLPQGTIHHHQQDKYNAEVEWVGNLYTQHDKPAGNIDKKQVYFNKKVVFIHCGGI